MKDRRYFAAGLGFAFVAAWIAFGFGRAVLCLLGAAVFWIVASVLDGSLDLADVQQRLQRDEAAPPVSRPAAPRKPRFNARVK